MKRLADFHFSPFFFSGKFMKSDSVYRKLPVGADMANRGGYDGYLGPECRHHGICLSRSIEVD